MATLQAADIADMVVSTQKDLGKMRVTDIASTLQDHTAMTRMMRKSRVKFGSSTGIQWNLLTEGDGNARNVGLFDVDNLNQVDGLEVANVPWRHSVSGYVFDRRQFSMNRNKSKIVDFVKTKRYQQMIGMTNLMEANFWGEPDSSSDKTTPFGLKYYMVYNASEGFNGGNNAKFAGGPGGVDRDTLAAWKNYTAQYANVTKTDLIRKMRRAFAMCQFRASVPNPPIPQYAGRNRYGIYTTYDTLALMEELAEAQNDSLGNDVASKDGKVTFRRVEVEWVPYLQSNEATADPIVGIDWSALKTVYLKGEYLREDPPEKKTGTAHNVMEAFVDCTYNFICYDCRRLFLIAKSTWH